MKTSTQIRALAGVQARKVQSTTPSGKTRAILTADQAVAIFKIKLSNQTANKSQTLGPCLVARAFGVSEKAVRDIWNYRTWLRETRRFDPAFTKPGLSHHDLMINDTSSAINSNDAVSHTRPSRPLSLSNTENLASVSIPSTDIPGNVAWWERVQAQCGDGGHGSQKTIGFSLLNGDGRAWWVAEEAPLPQSSRADDPFHDDWRYWPQEGESKTPQCVPSVSHNET